MATKKEKQILLQIQDLVSQLIGETADIEVQPPVGRTHFSSRSASKETTNDTTVFTNTRQRVYVGASLVRGIGAKPGDQLGLFKTDGGKYYISVADDYATSWDTTIREFKVEKTGVARFVPPFKVTTLTLEVNSSEDRIYISGFTFGQQ